MFYLPIVGINSFPYLCITIKTNNNMQDVKVYSIGLKHGQTEKDVRYTAIFSSIYVSLYYN